MEKARALRLLIDVIGKADLDKLGQEWTDLYAAYWQAVAAAKGE